ncbi:MAG: hypothetical protein KC503_22970 [Myxococcales bacterium]|nr:hypothetical protein [Myxococcales bacterium]
MAPARQRVLTTTATTSKRAPSWGLAIVAWERPSRLGYQFEDGRLRVIHRDYAHLLSEVDRLDQEQQASSTTAAARKDGALSSDEQLSIFSVLYPGGFADPKWVAEVRGEGKKRRLKKHRAPAIAEAQKLLGRVQLAELCGKQRHDEIVARVAQVYDGIDLVSPALIEPLRQMTPNQQRALSYALVALLWGENPYPLRFERFLRAIDVGDKTPPWRAATALSALVHPDEHVCVRGSVFRAQARWMSPRLRFDNTPTGPLYRRLREMTRRVDKRLREAGHTPRDLFDVHDFIWVTLRPAGRKVLEASG